MRIVYLHQYFNTPRMSGGTRSYEMARRLVRYGHQVHMITSYREDGPSQSSGDGNGNGSRNGNGSGGWFCTEEDGIQVHWIPVPYSNRMSYPQRIKAFFKFAWKSAFRSASLNCDVVFATSTPLTIALPAVFAARRRKVPLVFEIRDLWPKVPIVIGALRNPLAKMAAKWLERFAYRNSARVVALSPVMKEGVISTGYPEEKVTVIPNSSDLELFDVDPARGREMRARYPWLQDRPLFVYAGTIGLVNGLEYLARLAAATWPKDPEIRFLIIGSGREEEKVRQTAEELGVYQKNFFMLGRVPKEEIPAWLSAADMASSICIDVKEVWLDSANKFFDALAAGRPVAINYGGWMADFLLENDIGLVLSNYDLETSANQIVEKLNDKAWLERATRDAQELARQHFDRNDLAKQLEQTLQAALTQRT